MILPVMRRRIIKYAEDLINIESPSGCELELIEYLDRQFKERGLSTELTRHTDKVATLEAARGETDFIICTHADTVLPIAPYRKRGEVIEGTGSADAKGQIAALIAAVEYCDYPARILITSDEEQGGQGSRYAAIGNAVKGILILEPTQFKICRLQAGAIEVKAVVKSRSYHASCSVASENPILRASRFLSDLSEVRKKPASTHGLPSITPYYIRSGSPDLFASPDEAEIKLDIPVNPEETLEKVLADITEIADQHGVEIEIIDAEPGFSLIHDSHLSDAVMKAYDEVFELPPEFAVMPSWTDGANFALRGYDVVVFGAGDLKHAHTPYEHVKIADLVKLAEFLISFMKIAAAADE